MVKLLLDKHADLSVGNNDGITSLNMAFYQGYKEVVKLLLDKHADPSVGNNDGTGISTRPG